jgi:protein-L-isoaspartate(D-aspartate) O-methyltransferase
MIAMPQVSHPASLEPTSYDFATARFNMVEGQLRPNKVTDLRLLAAMGEIPRELFVPSTLVDVAYADENIPLIADRMLMQPMVLARLMQAAEVTPQDRVLDLAPATGYSTLVFAALAHTVIGVEPDAVLYKEAETNAAKYAPGRVSVLAGAPVEGCISHPPHAPFDVIFINGSAEFLPEAIFNQLAEGGRLVVVMRQYGPAHAAHTGQARLYRKTNGTITWTPLFDANIPLAPGFVMPRGFTF